MKKLPVILLRGGGDLATGVALRLHRVGLKMIITELAQPLAVRRLVSLGNAVYSGQMSVEGVTSQLAKSLRQAREVLARGEIPVFVDPELENPYERDFNIVALVDARMRKRPPGTGLDAAPLVIGLGPGFVAGVNCHAVVETNRGHFLGRVLWEGAPEPNTGVPGKVGPYQHERVLRAPQEGVFRTMVEIGARVNAGTQLAVVGPQVITAPFDGVVRGLLVDGLAVHRGMKVGDLDPRNDPRLAITVSEKALAIGGGVLEALLTRPEVRSVLWN